MCIITDNIPLVKKALGDIYKRHRASIDLCSCESEDLLQDGIVALAESIKRNGGVFNSTYAYRRAYGVMRDNILDMKRGHSGKLYRKRRGCKYRPLYQLPEIYDAPDKNADNPDNREEAWTYLQWLPKKHRDVVLLNMYGWNRDEVAAAMHMSKWTASVLYNEALRIIRIRKRGIDEIAQREPRPLHRD